MDLNASLHAAAADPPPTRIDLDSLIRAEARRGYRQRRLLGAGAVSGVAVLVGAASVAWPLGTRAPIGDGEALVCPWVSPSVDPSFANRPPMASASPVPVPSGSVSSFRSDDASPPPSAPGTSDSSSSFGTSDSPNVEASGSPASPPPATTQSPSPGTMQSPPPTMPSASVSVPTIWASDLIGPDASPAGVCGDTLRRLEHVLRDALARVAPNAHPRNAIQFLSHRDGTVRAVVFFDGSGGQLSVTLLPLWADSYQEFTMYFFPLNGTSYDIGSPTRGLVAGNPATGPLTADQLQALANEPGLTLTS